MRHTVHLENLPFSLKDKTNKAAKHLQTWIFHTMGFKGQHFFFAVLACRSLRCSRFPVFLRSDSHVFFLHRSSSDTVFVEESNSVWKKKKIFFYVRCFFSKSAPLFVRHGLRGGEQFRVEKKENILLC